MFLKNLRTTITSDNDLWLYQLSIFAFQRMYSHKYNHLQVWMSWVCTSFFQDIKFFLMSFILSDDLADGLPLLHLSFMVSISELFSSISKNGSGIPQGSVMGLRQFSLCVLNFRLTEVSDCVGEWCCVFRQGRQY